MLQLQGRRGKRVVDNLVHEYRLDPALVELHKHMSEQIQLLHFVVDGEGDARRIFATIASDKKVEELSLPDRKALFRLNEKLQDRFNAVSGHLDKCVFDLAKEFADEQRSQCRALAEKLSKAKRGEIGEEAASLEPDEIMELELTNYARFGTG